MKRKEQLKDKYVSTCFIKRLIKIQADFEMKIDAKDFKRYVSPVEFYSKEVPVKINNVDKAKEQIEAYEEIPVRQKRQK